VSAGRSEGATARVGVGVNATALEGSALEGLVLASCAASAGLMAPILAIASTRRPAGDRPLLGLPVHHHRESTNHPGDHAPHGIRVLHAPGFQRLHASALNRAVDA